MISVYTCMTAGKDNVLESLEIKRKSQARWTAFLDTPYLSPTWTVEPAYNRFKDPRRNSRIQKILSHLYFTDEYTIYVDANIRLLKTPEELVEKHLKEYDIAVFKHPNRDCIYDEATLCAVRALDDPEVIIEQAKWYEDSGYAKHKGLCECGIILRRNTAKVREFNVAWWAQYSRFSKRDQISFMYAADEVGISVNVIHDFFVDVTTSRAVKQSGDFEIFIHQHML